MFTGLKVAAVLSMIGAIVGEYFGGPTNALGVSILNDTQLFNFPRRGPGIGWQVPSESCSMEPSPSRSD
jgi:ABC-type nitrate/sulfonate/bicarbonate transport system permease component